jgi:hypothetical protein
MNTNIDFLPTSFFYYRSSKWNITVAYRRSSDRSQVIYGAAFCRLTDRFDKRLGRQIAEGRMRECTEFISTPNEPTRLNTHFAILSHLSSTTYAPTNSWNPSDCLDYTQGHVGFVPKHLQVA